MAKKRILNRKINWIHVFNHNDLLVLVMIESSVPFYNRIS